MNYLGHALSAEPTISMHMMVACMQPHAQMMLIGIFFLLSSISIPSFHYFFCSRNSSKLSAPQSITIAPSLTIFLPVRNESILIKQNTLGVASRALGSFLSLGYPPDPEVTCQDEVRMQQHRSPTTPVNFGLIFDDSKLISSNCSTGGFIYALMQKLAKTSVRTEIRDFLGLFSKLLPQ